MELETLGYHNDPEDGNIQDCTFSYVLDSYPKHRKLVEEAQSYVEFSYHPTDDLVVISTLNKNLCLDKAEEKDIDLDEDEDKPIATFLKVEEKRFEMTSSEIDGAEDLFPWTNELKIALSNVKSDEESNAEGSYELSDSSNVSGKVIKRTMLNIWKIFLEKKCD